MKTEANVSTTLIANPMTSTLRGPAGGAGWWAWGQAGRRTWPVPPKSAFAHTVDPALHGGKGPPLPVGCRKEMAP